jgi:predicted small lipoprotein YifL
MKTCRVKSVLALSTLALLAGCGLPGAPLPPSLELPKPVTDLRAERQGSKVTLTWTSPRETTDHAGIRRMGATRICRAIAPLGAMGTAPKACETFVSAVNMPPSKREEAHPAPVTFADTLPTELQAQHPLDAAVYTVEVLNDLGRAAGESNAASVALARTLPPPDKLEAQVTADGPVIGWTVPMSNEGLLLLPESAARRGNPSYGYRLFRREKDKPTAQPAIIPVDQAFASPLLRQPNMNVRDTTAEWEKTYVYLAAVVTSVASEGKSAEVLGDPSPTVEVFVHDVFPPRPPEGLQAVFTEAGTQRYIDLTWLPSGTADIAAYNIYRWEQDGQPVKINAAALKTPTFHDANVAAGHRYLYAVTAIDIRNNESARSQPANETVPK